MKHKRMLISLVMATIVLVAMTAVAGVSAAQPANVQASCGCGCGAPSTSFNSGTQMTFVQGSNCHLWGISSAPLDGHGALTWVDFGLAITGQPAVVWIGGTSFTVVAPTASGITAIKSTDTGLTWTAIAAGTWPGAVLACTGVAAVSNTAGTIQVFYADSATHHLMVDTQASPGLIVTQKDLGGMVYATPAATMVNNGATPTSIVVVVKGTGGTIWEKTGSMGAWGGYTKFHDGTIGLGAALDSPAFNTVVLFVVGQNSHLYTLVSTDGGLNWALKTNGIFTTHNLDWQNAGGVCYSAPGTSDNAGTVTTLVRGGNCRMYTNTGVAPYNVAADFAWGPVIPPCCGGP